MSRFMHFFFVGLLNTAFGFTAYALLTLATLPVWLALIGSNVAGVTFNFFSTGGLVFKDLAAHRFPKFVAVYGVVYFLNLLAIRLLLNQGLGAIAAQAVIALPMAVISYLLLRALVFPTANAIGRDKTSKDEADLT